MVGRWWSLLVAVFAAALVVTESVINKPKDFDDLPEDDEGFLSRFGNRRDDRGGHDICDGGFPRKKDDRLDTRDKKMAFKDTIRDTAASEVFVKLMGGSPLIDFSKLSTEDVRKFLETVVDDEDGDILSMIRNLGEPTTGEGFKHLTNFLVDHPQMMRILKKPAVEHVLANLTMEDLHELCDNLDQSDLSESRMFEVLKDFPHCVIVAHEYINYNMSWTDGAQSFKHGRAILDLIRYWGVKLNVTDFLLDPRHVTVEDIDALRESDLIDIHSLEIMAYIAHMLDKNVMRRYGERVAEVISLPSEWPPQLSEIISHLVTYLPDEFMQEHVDDTLLEAFLDSGVMLSKRVVSFMVESLYDKRNEPSFFKRFCLSLYHHPYITVSMLDDFTPLELGRALRECPHIFYDMAFANLDLLLAYDYEDEYGGSDMFGNQDGNDDYFHPEWDPEHFEFALREKPVENLLKKMAPNIMQLRPLMRRIFSDRTITLNETQLMEFAIFLPAAPSYVFENIPTDVLMDVWPEIQSFGKFPLKTLQVVGEKIFNHTVHRDRHTLGLLGQAMSVIPCGAIREFPDEELLMLVLNSFFQENNHFSCEINEVICRTIAKKALHHSPEGLRRLVMDNLGQLAGYLDIDDFEDEEIFFNDYFSDHLEKTMFKRKDRQERERANSSEESSSKFVISEEEEILDAFLTEGKAERRNGTKLPFKDALLVKMVKDFMRETSFSELDFTKEFEGKTPRFFNSSYLATIDFEEGGDEFSMWKFGDIEEFLYRMFNTTWDDIVHGLVLGKVDLDGFEFAEEAFHFFANEDFLEEIPGNEESLEFLEGMKDNLKQRARGNGRSVDPKELSGGFKVISDMFELHGNNSKICLDDSVIDSLDCYFTRARKFELEHFSNRTRKSILVAEGRSRECVASMTPDEIQEHFQALLEVDDELRHSDVWGQDLLMRIGPALLCGMNASHVARLTPRAAFLFSDVLCQCGQLNNGARRAIFDKIKAFYNGDVSNIFKPPYNMDVASCLMYASPAELRSMTPRAKKVFVAMAGRVLDEIHDHVESIRDFDFLDVEDVVEEVTNAEELASAVWAIMEDLDVPAMDRLSHLSHFKSVINVDFLNELSDQEFEEAVDFLQDFDGWTDGQKDALVVRIDETFGDVANWTGSDILRMGGLLSAKLESGQDFGQIDLDECAMDFILDRFADNEDLFEGICERMTVENAIETIRKKPQAICCIDTSDISHLNATFIMRGIAAMSGECHPCLKDRRDLVKELGRIVADHIQNRPNNDTSKDFFEELKCVAGKMPRDFLERISTDRLERFDRDAIEGMDPEVFCKIANKDFLKDISSIQIEAIDDAKLECMDIQQFEAFWEAVEGSGDDDYHYDDDEEFPDFSVTKIGDSADFSELLGDLSGPITQPGSGNQNMICVSSKGANIQGITRDGKRKLRQTLQGDELELFNSLDKDPNVNLTDYSEADIIGFLEEIDEAFEDMPLNFTEFLSELPTMVADPGVSNYDEILEEAFELINPELYLLIEPNLMCNSVKQLKKKHLNKLCGRMLKDDVSTHTFITINTFCPVCFAYWIKQRKDETFYDILDEQMASAFYGMRLRQNKPLDIDTLALGPRGITPDVIKAVDPKSFASVSQLAVLSHPNVAKRIPKNAIKMILKKIMSALGPIGQWNKMIKSRLQYFLLHLPRKDLLNHLSPSDVIEIVTSREGETEGLDDPEIRQMLGQVLNKYVMENINTIESDLLKKPEVFCLLLSSGMPRKLLDSKTSPYRHEYLLDMAYECSQYYDISPSAARKFLRAIIKDVTKDKDNLEKLKDVLKLLPKNDLKKFPKVALKQLWEDVKHQEFDEFQLRVFWDAMKDDFEELDCDTYEEYGQLMRVMPRSLLDNADLLTCMKGVMDMVVREGEIDIPESLKRPLWSMIKDKVGASTFIFDAKFPVKTAILFPKSEFDQLTWDVTSKFSRQRVFAIAEYLGDQKSDLIGNIFSDLDLDDPEILEHVLEDDDVASVVFSLLDDDTLGRLSSGDGEGNMLEELAGDVEHMSTRSLEKNVALMKKRIGLKEDCVKETICLDEGQARVLGPLFVGVRPTEMECLTKTTREIIIESIGRNKKLCKRLTKASIQKLLGLVDTTQAIQAGDDLDMLYGCMICGFTNTQIQGLSDEQVASLQDTFSDCHQFDKSVKDIIVNKIYSHYGGFSNYLESNPDVGIGTLLMSVDVSDITSLNDDTLEFIVASLGDITLELREELADMKERIASGEITAANYDTYFNAANGVLATLYDMIAPSSPTKRRRRAVSNSDEECDILSSFNGNLCFLTEVQVSSLSDQSVADCASEFQQCSYSDAIFTTLATKAKTALGATSDWTANDYASLGKLLGYMGDVTIAEMELTDDILAAIPNVQIENGDDIFNQYLSHNSKSLSDLTGENIADYALLLGELDDDELNALEPSAVADAVITYDLGGNDLSPLDDDVVELFTNKLIEADTFNFTEASASDISSLGLLAGELPENVLSDLSTEQKSGISADALQNIEPDVLSNAFTPSDFAAMTSDQANALTEDQLGQLSGDQRIVVSAIATNILDDDSPEGHASTISASVGMMIILMFGSLWILRLE